MILDVEQGFKDYLEDNMDELTGNGNFDVEIHKEKFPDNAKPEGISVYAELPAPHQVFEIFLVGVRFHTRARKKSHAFYLIQNLDKLIDRRANADLSDDLNLCYCLRNSGPSHFFQDNLHYYMALYEMEVRQVGS